jgi:hypothetical protein
VKRDGKPVTCLLLSAAVPENPAPRAWVEEEYCIDPATNLLQMWSAAPGVYAEYDYPDAAEYHEHILPRQISIFEGGTLVSRARVESFGDPGEIEANVFQPGPEMTDVGESFMLSGPRRFPMRVDPSDAPTSTYFQPVIVHATLDAQERAGVGCRAAAKLESRSEPGGHGAGEEHVVPGDRIPAGSLHHCAVSFAGAGTGWPAGIALVRALGDLGAPRKSASQAADSSGGVRVPRGSFRIPPFSEITGSWMEDIIEVRLRDVTPQ